MLFDELAIPPEIRDRVLALAWPGEDYQTVLLRLHPDWTTEEEALTRLQAAYELLPFLNGVPTEMVGRVFKHAFPRLTPVNAWESMTPRFIISQIQQARNELAI